MLDKKSNILESRKVQSGVDKKCTTCNGNGFVRTTDGSLYDDELKTKTCPVCNGSGIVTCDVVMCYIDSKYSNCYLY